MPWRSEIVHCKGRTCRAPIIWIRHAVSGRRMCFEAEPISEQDAVRDPRGVFYRRETDGLAVSWGRGLEGMEVGALYRSHWGSCPDQAKFRKGKKS